MRLVVVLGVGSRGPFTARRPNGAAVDVTVIDRTTLAAGEDVKRVTR